MRNAATYQLGLTITLLALVCGCARTKTDLTVGYGGTDLEKPAKILVYDFDVTPGEVGLDSSPGRKVTRRKQDDIDQTIGKAVAGSLSERLVKELQKMGLPAQRHEYTKHVPLRGAVLKIQGEFLKIDEGKRLRRMVIGFGAGSAEVTTQTHVFLANDTSSQLVQQFQSSAKSGIRPGIGVMTGVGAVAGTAATTAVVSSTANVTGEAISGEVAKLANSMAKNIAKNLRPFFEDQGWTANP